jgi:hypothetical protein
MPVPVDEYDIFREQLAIKYPSYGHGLWEPSPWKPDRPVAVGDVGFIRKGRFHNLFNAMRPAEDNPMCQNIMNNFSQGFQIISALFFSVPAITVRPESAWHLNQTSMPLGSCDPLSTLFIGHH